MTQLLATNMPLMMNAMLMMIPRTSAVTVMRTAVTYPLVVALRQSIVAPWNRSVTYPLQMLSALLPTLIQHASLRAWSFWLLIVLQLRPTLVMQIGYVSSKETAFCQRFAML
jgi:hypothetical protein